MNKASDESVANTTWATIALVVIILLVVYRSPLLALIPILTIALSVWVSLMAIAVLAKLPGLNFQVINITNLFVIVVLFGAGTDYCLFLIARYREELIRGLGRDEALREAISKVGGALVASAGTVIVGLGMLWFSSFAKIQYTGPAIALSLAIGLLAALTLAPVLLHWLRGAVFWPFQPAAPRTGRRPRGREPRAAPDVGLLGRGGRPGRPPSRGDHGALRAGTDAPGGHRRADEVQLQPARRPQPRSRQHRRRAHDPAPFPRRRAGHDERPDRPPPARLPLRRGTRGARSAQPAAGGHPQRRRGPLGLAAAGRARGARREPEHVRAGCGDRPCRLVSDSRYISVYAPKAEDRNHITRIDLVFKTDPFSDPSLQALDATRRVVKEASGPGGPLEGASASGVTGSTALVNDLKTVTQQDERKMYFLVTLGVYVILVLLLRRPGICLYLMVTVLLGYLASLGVTELVFQALHTGPTPWVGLDWKVGFFLFVILVAVGEDYNIFLMSRVIEEERSTGRSRRPGGRSRTPAGSSARAA